MDHFIYTVKPWVPCSWTKKVSKNCYAQFCNKEDKENAELQVTHRRWWGKCRGFKRQNFQPAQMYTLSSYETNAPHLHFFQKESSTDVAPLKFQSAMCLSNLFLYKATLSIMVLCGSILSHWLYFSIISLSAESTSTDVKLQRFFYSDVP